MFKYKKDKVAFVKKKKIVLSVTNDLVSDQRVHKIATSLKGMGFEVTLLGRRFKGQGKTIDRTYNTYRFKLLFNKKVWFYAEYNLRLFLFLLFHNFDLYLANDLDTLLPNYLVSKLKGRNLIYDSHEYFTEVPELISRPQIRAVWLAIEQYIFPKLKTVYTVNESIAEIYKAKYNVEVKVIRNIAPRLKNKEIDQELSDKIKGESSMLIMQGAGINIDRGAEELVTAMQWIKNTILYIIGSGDVFYKLKDLVLKYNLKDRVFILDKLPYEELMEYTKIADLGISIDKGTNPNYENSLPNKVFDYIQAQIPLLVSNRKVVSALVKKNDIGWVIETVEPKNIADRINKILEEKTLLKRRKENLIDLAEKFSWEKEELRLKEIYRQFL